MKQQINLDDIFGLSNERNEMQNKHQTLTVFSQAILCRIHL